MTAPTIVNHEITYYTINFWIDRNEQGGELINIYKTEKGALKKAQTMIESGLYEIVQVRKETVWKRDEHNEFSASSPYKRFERKV